MLPGRMIKRLLRRPSLRRVAAGIIGSYLKFAIATTRWTVEGEEHLAKFYGDTAVIVALWHECLPVMPVLWRRMREINPARRGTALISRHSDGLLIAEAMARFGLATAHGSSAQRRASQDAMKQKGGAEALLLLARLLRKGEAVAITPDGPRGPRRILAPGVAHLAFLSGTAVLPAAAQKRFRIVVPSWDRMIVPLPFGRGSLVCKPALQVSRDGIDAACATLTEALTAAMDRAEALCR